MPKDGVGGLRVRTGCNYLLPYNAQSNGRASQAITQAGGLARFGANIVTLAPGAWSSHRHWHSAGDEMVIMRTGQAVMVEDDGHGLMCAGDVACFAANSGNGHHLRNRTSAACSFVANGTHDPEIDQCHYPDIDLHLDAAGFGRKTDAAR